MNPADRGQGASPPMMSGGSAGGARYALEQEGAPGPAVAHVRLFQHALVSPFLLGLLYAMLALLSLYLSRQPGSIATTWYANAVAVAFLLHAPLAAWGPMALATGLACALANLLWDPDLTLALSFAAANLMEIALAVGLLRHARMENANLRSPWAVVRLFALGCMLPQLVGATAGAMILQGQRGLLMADTWLGWFVGSVIGSLSVLLLACLCLRLPPRRLRQAWRDWRFLALLPLTLGVTLWAVGFTPFTFIFLSVPLLWAAMVVELAAVALLTFLVSVTVAAALGTGLFVPPPMTADWEQLYVYLGFAAALVPAPLMASTVAAMRDGQARAETRSRELEVANERLEQFVRIAAHDLREPLNTIEQFGGLLQLDAADRLEPDTREYLRLMNQASRRMRRLLDDVLNYARLSRDADEPVAPVDLSSVLQEVREGLAATLGERRARLEVGPLPVVSGHASLLSLLFQNLVSNGLKFVPPGRAPQVEVRAERRQGWQVVMVRDNGIGIPPADVPRLFKPFARLHPQRLYEGTGLGLTLCQQAARAHGGRIEVVSTPGEGSCFEVWLPAPEDGTEGRAPGGARAS